jgi:type IV secretory pathway TrbD component
LDLLQALIRGPVQGAAEPLTLSSSAQWTFVLGYISLVLCLGTLTAALFYFWRDWLTLWCAGLYALRTRSTQDPEVRLLRLLMEGTIPAAGFLLETPCAFSDHSLSAAVRRVLGVGWASPRTADLTSSTLNVGNTLLVSLAQAGVIRRSRRHVPAGTGRRELGPVVGDKAFLRSLFWETATGQGMIVPLCQDQAAGCWGMGPRRVRRRRGFAGWFGTQSLLVALLL